MCVCTNKVVYCFFKLLGFMFKIVHLEKLKTNQFLEHLNMCVCTNKVVYCFFKLLGFMFKIVFQYI